MDEVASKIIQTGDKKTPCSYCGVFRRQGINHLATRVNADVIALGHNLDDMAQTIMMNMQNGDLERTLRLAPHTNTPLEGMAPRIVPLRWVPEQEIHLYALHRNLPIHRRSRRRSARPPCFLSGRSRGFFACTRSGARSRGPSCCPRASGAAYLLYCCGAPAAATACGALPYFNARRCASLA